MFVFLKKKSQCSYVTQTCSLEHKNGKPFDYHLPRSIFVKIKGSLHCVLICIFSPAVIFFAISLGAAKVVRNPQMGNVLSLLRTGGGWANLG